MYKTPYEIFQQDLQNLIQEKRPEYHVGLEVNKKYIRYFNSKDGIGKCALCFVEIDTGNVFKAASWKQPYLKRVRGNISDIAKLMEQFTPFGMKNLR